MKGQEIHATRRHDAPRHDGKQPLYDTTGETTNNQHAKLAKLRDLRHLPWGTPRERTTARFSGPSWRG